MKKKIGLGGLLLIGILILTWYFVFRNYPMREMLDILANVDLRYVGAGIGCMGIFLVCEGCNIRRALKVQGREVCFSAGLRYAVLGFFFSSVTPASTGGQPVQLLKMHRDGIPAAYASMALLLELSSYQTVVILFGMCGLIALYPVLEHTIGAMSCLIMIGVFGNMLYLAFVLMAIFSKRVSVGIMSLLSWLMEKLRIRSRENICDKLCHMLEEYQRSAQIVRRHPVFIIKMLLTTAVQMLAMYSIPIWVYQAFGIQSTGGAGVLAIQGLGILKILALQAILYISVSVLPLPGAVGVSEGGFLLLFQLLFSEGQIGEAMLLCRGISFYLPVLICGVLIAAESLRRGKKTCLCCI